MNIHTKDESLINQFDRNYVFQGVMGSTLYGTTTETSDRDLLTIYIDKNVSFVDTHHQFQYKEPSVDYVYTSLKTYLKNLISGDSTINYEILFGEEIKDSPLAWLTDYTKDFQNYNLIKGYLGFAKRDLKLLKKKYNNKKAYHFVRSIVMAENIMKKREILLDDMDIELLNDIRNDKLPMDEVLAYETLMNDLRDEAYEMLKSGYLYKTLPADIYRAIDDKYKETVKQTYVEEIDYGHTIYKVIESGVSYD